MPDPGLVSCALISLSPQLGHTGAEACPSLPSGPIYFLCACPTFSGTPDKY